MTLPSANEVDAHIGSRLKHFRQSVGLSTVKLGDTLGVTYQQVQKYENGSNRISAATLKRISDALGVEVGAFFPDADRLDESVTGAQVAMARRMEALDPKVQRDLRDLIEAIGATSAV